MNPHRSHPGFDVWDALSGAYLGGERDPDDVKFSLHRAVDGSTEMRGEDGQLACWRQERQGNTWVDVGEIVFGAMKTQAFEEAARRVRAKNG